MFVSPLLCLVLATTGFAIPFHHGRRGTPIPTTVLQNELPSGQTSLVVPSNAIAKAVVVGVGTQNYTCKSGNFSSIGALATMFDISNFNTSSTEFATIQDSVFKSWSSNPATNAFDPAWTNAVETQFGLNLVGVHSFVVFSNGVLSPMFDFSPSTGNADDFLIMKKTGDLPSPTSPQNVDWIELATLEGGFANLAFRVLTDGGVASAQCTGSENTIVKYAAQYFFI